MKLNFTTKKIDELPLPTKGKRGEYSDETITGLTLRITQNGVKTFSVVKRVEGKMARVTIGRYPILTVKQARIKAIDILGTINQGTNPNAKAKENELKKITLVQVLDDYIESRGTNLKENTTKNYIGIFNGYLKDWGNKELLNITRDMVEKKHRTITQQSPTRANTTMRLLRALFNYAMGEYENAQGEPIIFHNPIQRLSHVKAWNREKRKQTVIKIHDLKAWWNGIHELPNHALNDKKPNHADTVKDFLILVLMTGLRRREASNLTWDSIDFQEQSLSLEETKNHEPHKLPLTDFLIELLQRRREQTNSVYVFEGTDPSKPMNDPKKQVEKARKISEVYFNIHDLRRTFLTIAESLDIPSYALKKLANHKDQRDVTAGYIIMDIERLREPMNKIGDYILEQVR